MSMQISDVDFDNAQAELAKASIEVLKQALSDEFTINSENCYKVNLALKFLAVVHNAPTPGTVSISSNPERGS